MTMIRTATAVAAFYATAEAVNEGPKTAAIDKVVNLMTSLREKIMNEHEEEAKSYDKFQCWCKATVGDTAEAIESGKAEILERAASIRTLQSKRDTKDSMIAETEAEVGAANEKLKKQKAERMAALKTYRKTLADHNSALNALHEAVQSLKASKAASFVQVSTPLRSTLAFADAMGMLDGIPKKTLALLQEPTMDAEVNMEDYQFRSQGVIGTLQGLRDKVLDKKNDLDKAEVEAVKLHDSFVQTTLAEIKNKETLIADSKRARSEHVSEIESLSTALSSLSALARQDQENLIAVQHKCVYAVTTYDQRSTERANEVTALTSVLTIMQNSVSDKVGSVLRLSQQPVSVKVARRVAMDPAAMAAIEAAAESVEATSFVQTKMLSQVHRHLRGSESFDGDDTATAVVDLLMSRGHDLKSVALTALAGKVTALAGQSADPLAKVKTLIEELILRLKEEDNKSVNQKGWCDKSTADAELARDAAVKESRLLDGRLAKNHARLEADQRESLKLQADRKKVKSSLSELQIQRDTESEENKANIEDSKDGLVALKQCIGILESHYADAAAATETVQTVLAQTSNDPFKDMPDSGFENGEAYKGAQGESTGIMAMLEVMETDFERTITDVTKAEETSVKTFKDTTNQMEITVQTIKKTLKSLADSIGDLTDKNGDDQESLATQTAALVGQLKTLQGLKQSCVDTTMSYEERVRQRDAEIESLKKAVCILANHKNADAVDC